MHSKGYYIVRGIVRVLFHGALIALATLALVWVSDELIMNLAW